MHNFQKRRESDLKSKKYESNPYKAFMRGKPCVTCMPLPKKAEPHHEQITGRGIGLKCSDYEILPLCKECHRKRHDQGKYTFWAEHFFSIAAVTSQQMADIDFCLAKLIIGYLSEYIHRRKNVTSF